MVKIKINDDMTREEFENKIKQIPIEEKKKQLEKELLELEIKYNIPSCRFFKEYQDGFRSHHNDDYFRWRNVIDAYCFYFDIKRNKINVCNKIKEREEN
jgi:hypothetical protein